MNKMLLLFAALFLCMTSQAQELGYKDVDYFHKKFKKYVGVSPNEYRRKPAEPPKW